jgi:hypothetical protein
VIKIRLMVAVELRLVGKAMLVQEQGPERVQLVIKAQRGKAIKANKAKVTKVLERPVGSLNLQQTFKVHHL